MINMVVVDKLDKLKLKMDKEFASETW
jgi:hypothetical protein